MDKRVKVSAKPGVSVVIPTNKKGLRNGNWRKLRFLDKALYRAAMGYARYGRSIVNGLLVEKLLGLIKKWLKAGDGAVKMKIGKYLN